MSLKKEKHKEGVSAHLPAVYQNACWCRGEKKPSEERVKK